ncbi:hypothetical protein KUV85_05775 [Nocardioides panacisoli]|uniref:hypothetical protein n=1 Tax=Nocardioides panacisoli TaxID=627624 RepID=UPI001C62CF2B|nr:hypothetical protein [Nocardioides panacisoli]QYJ05190.1 hypothetical protein KUV85_05775 [Nocardioides panacisoli]
MTPRRWAVLGVLAALVVAGAVVAWRLGAESDPFEAYCAEVTEHQQPLGEVLSDGEDSTGFLDALPAFRQLADAAPRDIRDEWAIVVERIEGLEAAVAEASVDPATYDRADLPEGVTEEDRQRIDAAANALSAPESRTAFSAVAQHARDVCHTPLYL